MVRSMTRVAVAIALAGMLATSHVGATPAPWPGTCPSNGNKTLKAAGVGTVDAVDAGKMDSYKFSFASGRHSLFVESLGDIDIVVCRPGTSLGSPGAGVCYSHNPAGVTDACAPADVDPQVDGIADWDDDLPAGTYIVLLQACTEEACGYPADSPAPIPYALALA